MKRLLLILFIPFCLYAGDTLQYRVAYYPVWSYEDLPPYNLDFGGLTHIVLFNEAFLSTTSPYWTPAFVSDDSVDIERRNVAYNALDSLVVHAHRNGLYVMVALQCVDGTVFNTIAADSTKTHVFHETLRDWMVRKDIDGWDLNLESSWKGDTEDEEIKAEARSELNRFMRIGRRLGYNASFPSGRALIGVACPRGWAEDYWASQDSMVTFYDVQAYNFEYMWTGSANATWFLTPVYSPTQPEGYQNNSLNYDLIYAGEPTIKGWTDAGHAKNKLVIGISTSMVAGFTGTDALGSTFTDIIYDYPLVDVEAMTSYGGTQTRNSVAKASYMSGTATTGNPMGISNGTKFFLPYNDSVDNKNIIDFLDSAGIAGVMIYDFHGDYRPGASPEWKKYPYIYSASVYAESLSGGANPPAATERKRLFFRK